MPLDQKAKAIIKQIDDVLATSNVKIGFAASDAESITARLNILSAAIHRLAQPDSVYVRNAELHEQRYQKLDTMFLALEPLRGILLALRNDYQAGYLQSVTDLIHADIFADFLDMADYLLQQGYKDPAAVIAGSVLEEHLRKLCGKYYIAVLKGDVTPKTADTLNAELTGAGAYSKLDQKSVTAWLDLRNKAAHGKYNEYTKEQVTLMLQAVRDFASRNPA
jgi:hypothetical protein